MQIPLRLKLLSTIRTMAARWLTVARSVLLPTRCSCKQCQQGRVSRVTVLGCSPTRMSLLERPECRWPARSGHCLCGSIPLPRVVIALSSAEPMATIKFVKCYLFSPSLRVGHCSGWLERLGILAQLQFSQPELSHAALHQQRLCDHSDYDGLAPDHSCGQREQNDDVCRWCAGGCGGFPEPDGCLQHWQLFCWWPAVLRVCG